MLQIATSQELSFFQLVSKGGPIMVPIVLLLIIALYLFIERWIYISQNSKVNPSLIGSIKTGLNDGNVNSAIALCENERSSMGRIYGQGLKVISRPMSEMDRHMEDAASIELSAMESKLGVLGIIAGVAPMLGFIGTISGVIKIFYKISLEDNISIGIISGGLYEKMITSGAGLIVGVLAYTFLHLLQGRIDGFLLKMQRQVLEFKNLLL
ncbi:MAG: MotA/TolQ/ExbB proton channel family protein [Bacteroidia bacterium]|jgi:biopolymer transport protein ExbB